jgi:hypothetical protein
MVIRGENAGRKLSHTAVVRLLKSLGNIKTSANEPAEATTSIQISREWNRPAMHVIVFAQNRTTGRVIAISTGEIPGK